MGVSWLVGGARNDVGLRRYLMISADKSVVLEKPLDVLFNLFPVLLVDSKEVVYPLLACIDEL